MMNTISNAAPPAATPAAEPQSRSGNATPAAQARASDSGRAVEGSRPIFIPAAGLPVGNQQHDKIGFDSTGPSTRLNATIERQRDGTWLTKIDVPYGEQRGGDAMMGTDLATTLSFTSKHQPTIGARGELNINGQRIDGSFLETRLHSLKLPLPDYTQFRYGGPED